MQKDEVRPAVRDCMDLVLAQVTKANTLAQAARNCCDAGDYDAGFRIALEFEPLLHDATSMISAVSMLRRSTHSCP